MPRSCQYLDREMHSFIFFLFFPFHCLFIFNFTRGNQTRRVKLVEFRTKIAHFSAFSFASLTVSSTDCGSALTGPTSSESSYKSLKQKRKCLPGGIFFSQVLTALIFTTCEQVFAVLKMCWVIAHARHLLFNVPSVFKAFPWEHPC